MSSSPLSAFKKIPAQGDGNCAFNAWALGLGDLICGGYQFSSENRGYQTLLQGLFDAKVIPAATTEDFEKYVRNAFEKEDRDSIIKFQRTLAPVLRSIGVPTVDDIYRNETLKLEFIAGFEEYLYEVDHNQYFTRSSQITTVFAQLKLELEAIDKNDKYRTDIEDLAFELATLESQLALQTFSKAKQDELDELKGIISKTRDALRNARAEYRKQLMDDDFLNTTKKSNYLEQFANAYRNWQKTPGAYAGELELKTLADKFGLNLDIALDGALRNSYGSNAATPTITLENIGQSVHWNYLRSPKMAAELRVDSKTGLYLQGPSVINYMLDEKKSSDGKRNIDRLAELCNLDPQKELQFEGYQKSEGWAVLIAKFKPDVAIPAVRLHVNKQGISTDTVTPESCGLMMASIINAARSENPNKGKSNTPTLGFQKPTQLTLWAEDIEQLSILYEACQEMKETGGEDYVHFDFRLKDPKTGELKKLNTAERTALSLAPESSPPPPSTAVPPVPQELSWPYSFEHRSVSSISSRGA